MFIRKSQNFLAYLFLVPAIIYFIVFGLYPLFLSFYLTLHDWNGFSETMIFVGLKNFYKILEPANREFIQAFWITIVFVVVSVPIKIFLSIVLASMLNNKLFGAKFYLTSLFIPTITAGMAIYMVWTFIYDNSRYGFLNAIIGVLNIKPHLWLSDYKTAIFCIIFVEIIQGIGSPLILFLAGFQNIPKDIYTAAKLDGATEKHLLARITIPVLLPLIFYVTITQTISALHTFHPFFMMTDGKTELLGTTTTLYYHIYNSAFRNFDFGYAAAVSWLISGISGIGIIIANAKIFRKILQ